MHIVSAFDLGKIDRAKISSRITVIRGNRSSNVNTSNVLGVARDSRSFPGFALAMLLWLSKLQTISTNLQTISTNLQGLRKSVLVKMSKVPQHEL